MKAELACIPCIMKQAYNTATRATDDVKKIRRILDLTADYLRNVELDTTPADASNFAYTITKEVTGLSDPYKEEKRRFNKLCLEKVPEIEKKIESSEDPLKASVKVAIMGNIIDIGIGYAFDIDSELKRVFDGRFAVDDYDDFKKQLEGGKKRILYLGDNAGEIVFDRLLVERLISDHEVTFVVKKGPVINDATMEDARFVGMTDRVTVIDTGSDGIGVKWLEVSNEFIASYEAADVIISKGQGNFETMSDREKVIYFLLRAKCDSVARELSVSFGDIVFKRGGSDAL